VRERLGAVGRQRLDAGRVRQRHLKGHPGAPVERTRRISVLGVNGSQC
jgi:hypothetical protein